MEFYPPSDESEQTINFVATDVERVIISQICKNAIIRAASTATYGLNIDQVRALFSAHEQQLDATQPTELTMEEAKILAFHLDGAFACEFVDDTLLTSNDIAAELDEFIKKQEKL